MKVPTVRTITRATIMCLVVAASASYVERSRSGAPAFIGSLVEARIAPALVMPDSAGGTFDLAAQRGRLVLVYFGYRSCPDVCPATLADLTATMNVLGPDASNVRVAFVTLDPSRDTPEMVRDYLSNFTPPGGTPFVGLVADRAATAAAAARWGVTWRSADAGRYIDHTSLVTAVDPAGRVRLRYGLGQLGDPGAVAQDLRELLHGA